MAVVGGTNGISFSGTYAVAGYTPSGHQLKHEVWISGLKTTYDEPVKKFETTTGFTVGKGSVSGKLIIDTAELKNLTFPGQNTLTLEYLVYQIDANGTTVVDGAHRAATISFMIQVIDYGDVNVQITSPTSGQVFTVTI